ncbi:MAG: GNAT family N-acetyltransferase [Planctomycetota bacterium]
MEIARTERLRLRRFEASDVPDFIKWMADPRVMRFARTGTLSAKAAEVRFERMLVHNERHGYGLWAVTTRDDNQALGYCGLIHQEVDGHAEVEIGYSLTPGIWGRGYATEAARAAREVAWSMTDRPYLISLIHPENQASHRVAEKNGMRKWRETVWRDEPVWVYRVDRPSASDEPMD